MKEKTWGIKITVLVTIKMPSGRHLPAGYLVVQKQRQTCKQNNLVDEKMNMYQAQNREVRDYLQRGRTGQEKLHQGGRLELELKDFD